MWVNILITFIFQKGEAQDRTVSWALRELVNPEPCPAPTWVLGLISPEAIRTGEAASLSIKAGSWSSVESWAPWRQLVSSPFSSPSPSSKVPSQSWILIVLVVVEFHQPKTESFLLKKSILLISFHLFIIHFWNLDLDVIFTKGVLTLPYSISLSCGLFDDLFWGSAHVCLKVPSCSHVVKADHACTTFARH